MIDLIEYFVTVRFGPIDLSYLVKEGYESSCVFSRTSDDDPGHEECESENSSWRIIYGLRFGSAEHAIHNYGKRLDHGDFELDNLVHHHWIQRLPDRNARSGQ